jgi:hypothetical protein
MATIDRTAYPRFRAQLTDAELLAVSVELACRAGNTDIRIIQIYVVDGDTP